MITGHKPGTHLYLANDGAAATAGTTASVLRFIGRKDSCASPTGYITSVKATFDHQGLFVWHCHLLDHEDNSMMRPMRVV